MTDEHRGPERVGDAAARILDLGAARLAREDAAFERYRLAKIKADQTLDFEDGREALRAWRAYLDLAMSPYQRAEFERMDAWVRDRARVSIPRSGPAA